MCKNALLFCVLAFEKAFCPSGDEVFESILWVVLLSK